MRPATTARPSPPTCYVAKHATGREKLVRGDEPAGAAGRQDVRHRLRALIVECRTGTGRPIPTSWNAPRPTPRRRAQQPNSSAASNPRRSSSEERPTPVRCRSTRDLLSLGVLEAPGRYGAALALGEGRLQATSVLRRAALRSLPHARSSSGMPGRIVGETADTAASAAMSSPCRPGSSTPAGEGHLQHHHEPDAVALAGSSISRGSGLRGCARWGDLPALAAQSNASRSADSKWCSQTRQRSRSLWSASDGTRARSSRRRAGRSSGLPAGRDYEGMDDALLVAVTEQRTPEEIDRLADVLAEVTR